MGRIMCKSSTKKSSNSCVVHVCVCVCQGVGPCASHNFLKHSQNIQMHECSSRITGQVWKIVNKSIFPSLSLHSLMSRPPSPPPHPRPHPSPSHLSLHLSFHLLPRSSLPRSSAAPEVQEMCWGMTHANLPNRMENWNETGIFASDAVLSHLPTSTIPLFCPFFPFLFLNVNIVRLDSLRVSLCDSHDDHLCPCLFLCDSTAPPLPQPPYLTLQGFFLHNYYNHFSRWCSSTNHLKIVPVNFRTATSLFCAMIRYAWGYRRCRQKGNLLSQSSIPVATVAH